MELEKVKTITALPPEIKYYYNEKLLSIPNNFKDSFRLLQIVFVYQIKKMCKKNFCSIQKEKECDELIQEFIELYERIKKKKEDVEAKTTNITQRPFYYIKVPDKSVNAIWQRLRSRI